MASAKKTPGPRFVRYFGPLVQALKELGGSARPQEVKVVVAESMQLPEEVTTKRNKSGFLQFSNDVDWARFYLVNAGYIDASSPLEKAGLTFLPIRLGREPDDPARGLSSRLEMI